MKKEISPVMGAVIVVIVVLAAAVILWRSTQKRVNLPAKPPSGPIELPPSQMGRPMPGGRASAPVTAPGPTR